MTRILVVDDDAVSCQLLSDVLQRDGTTVVRETDPQQVLGRVESEPVDLAILDVRMPGMNGLELLRKLRERTPDLPIIIMTAFGSVDTAVQAIASGAIDYLSKPMDVDQIRRAVTKALSERTEVRAKLPGVDEVAGIAGRSTAMVEVYKAIARVAPSRSTVLILGESGTGKEMVSRAIHEHSPRRERPFIAVDCAALTETLLESELFGHVRGAFTGALTDKPGLFVEADGGTLFLDEIGDISPAMQMKLLRVLQEQQVRPVGGNQWRRIDVRVLAATNRDLQSAVAKGQFREDLYYRINVFTIPLPPLRERREDIPLLVEHLIRRAARESGKLVTGMSQEALELLSRYDWPGNVRELAHVIERSVVLAHRETIGLDELPHEVRYPATARPTDMLGDRPTLEELKRRYIHRVVEESGGNISRAAAILGVDRRSLYRMLQRYGMAVRGEGDGEEA